LAVPQQLKYYYARNLSEVVSMVPAKLLISLSLGVTSPNRGDVPDPVCRPWVLAKDTKFTRYAAPVWELEGTVNIERRKFLTA
jgi:hypothetical protein